jgi:hypothetical protein
MIFQTLLINSPQWSKTVVNDDMRCIDWGTGPEYPRIWRIDDYNRLTISVKLFARKFDVNIDQGIIGKLENYIQSK